MWSTDVFGFSAEEGMEDGANWWVAVEKIDREVFGVKNGTGLSKDNAAWWILKALL